MFENFFRKDKIKLEPTKETLRMEAEIVEWDEDILGTRPETVFANMFYQGEENTTGVEPVLGENLELINNHNRSLGSNVMDPRLNNRGLYYIDYKGLANYHFEGINMQPSVDAGTDEISVNGMHDLVSAVHDHKMQKVLKKLGIRTHESLAVLRLKQVLIGDKIYKVEEITDPNFVIVDGEKFTLPKDFIPVQQIRAWSTPYRIQEFTTPKEVTKYPAHVLHAKRLVEKELGKNLSVPEYLTWFVGTIGEQVATLHANNLHHGYLHTGNITLDGRLTDFDSVRTFEKCIEVAQSSGDLKSNDQESLDKFIQKEIQKDVRRAMSSLYIYVIQVLKMFGFNTAAREFYVQKIIEKYTKKNPKHAALVDFEEIKKHLSELDSKYL